MPTDFNNKYTELSLTGNIPIHPNYLYEFEAPDDLDTIIGLKPYLDEQDVSWIAYTNNQGQRCIATNITPVVLHYVPKSEVMSIRCQEQ